MAPPAAVVHASEVTLLLTFWASDGLVVVSDGLTSKVDAPPGQCGEMITQADDTEKQVVVPGQKIAVLLGGRAAFKTVKVAELCRDFLDQEFGTDSGMPPEEVTVERVAKVVHQRFEQLCRTHNGPNDESVWGLVAGFSYGEKSVPEVWHIPTPKEDEPPVPPAPVQCAHDFASYRVCWEQYPRDAGHKVEERVSRDLDDISTSRMADLIASLCVRLPQLVVENDRVFYGVGGTWQMRALAPDRAVNEVKTSNPRSNADSHQSGNS
jgi:hypothetical protein